MVNLSQSVLPSKVEVHHRSIEHSKKSGKMLAKEMVKHRRQELYYLKGLTEQDWKVMEANSHGYIKGFWRELHKEVKKL